MTVVELINILSQHPGNAEVEVVGDAISVDGVQVWPQPE